MSLPLSYNPFVGRTRELAELKDALQQFRLVTLTGPGGCGKTRLALECARQMAHQLTDAPADRYYADGVVWCDLAAVTDPTYVPARLVTALELAEHANLSSTDLITEALQAQQRLIILDNCEHLLAACAMLAETVLTKCPRVTILATSTQPLGLAQEHLYGVLPFAVPELPARLDADLLAALNQTDVLRLFLQRAQEVFPNFALNPQNIAAVVTICRRVDGLPLAIELAAARVKMLAPAQIVERLDDAFALLTRGSPVALPKHQTLRATLEWSYRLLSAPEQILLRRLSVFAGSFDVEMVEAICDHDLQAASLDVLTDLADKSLVSILQHDQVTVRYHLLETIRQYAREQLDAANEGETFRAHLLDWCIGLVERMQAELKGATQTTAFVRLEQEHDNLRAALQFALDTGRTEYGLRVAGALSRFWTVRGHLREGGQWLEQLLGQRSAPSDDQARSIHAGALYTAGVLAYRQNDYARAEGYFQSCLRLRQMLEDSSGIAFVLNSLGSVALDRGEFTRATALYQESLRLRREINDEWGIASTLNNLGNAAADQGEYERAAAMYAESLALYRRLGDQWSIASSLNNLGEVAMQQGDWKRAEALLRESLATRRALGEPRGIGLVLRNLADLALERHEWRQARALLKESLTLGQNSNAKEVMAMCFEGLAFLENAQGRVERAVRLCGMSAMLRETLRAPLTPAEHEQFDDVVKQVRAQLDERTFETLWLEGRALPLADAIAYAMTEPPIILPNSVELYITALGATSVQHNGIPLADTDWKYAKARELFFFLLTRERATKEQLGLALYPDVSATQLRARLHRILHHARQALQHGDWILFENDEYFVNRARSYWFDVEQFETRLRDAQQTLAATPVQTALAIRLLQDAAQLYTGDFLPDLDSEWILFRREELHRMALEALLQLGHLLFSAARYADALQVYQHVLALDNYLEVAHRELMRCYARQGDAGRARRHFQQLGDLLRTELGTQPSPETVRLDEQIRAGREV